MTFMYTTIVLIRRFQKLLLKAHTVIAHTQNQRIFRTLLRLLKLTPKKSKFLIAKAKTSTLDSVWQHRSNVIKYALMCLLFCVTI